jgi:Arc/MetJ-type ribon-helix-helix transcriptional regulator
MATVTIKSTYALDTATVRTLERLARLWGVSKSEVLRRAIRGAAAQLGDDGDAVKALDRLQRATALTAAQAGAWERRNRTERHAASARRVAGAT